MTSPADDRARVSMLVRVPPAVAFRAFTEDIDQWWRQGRKYRVAAKHRSIVHIEGGVGGRLFESFETSTGTKNNRPKTFIAACLSKNVARGKDRAFLERG